LNSELQPIAGSFRDPGGQVFAYGGRIVRTIMPSASDDFSRVEQTGILSDLVESGMLVPWSDADPAVLSEIGGGAVRLLEHEPLKFVCHPYEWSFGGLKAAALLHLDVQLHALERDVVLSDATAYNIQFNGAAPVFIDHLSFKPYQEGMFWQGHRQFCEQFLNPLVLNAYCGIPHHAWYRGTLEGVPSAVCSSLIPLWRKISPNVLTNIVLPARFEASARKRANRQGGVGEKTAELIGSKSLPKSAYLHILSSLKSWISKLEPRAGDGSVWEKYAGCNSYQQDQERQKSDYVANFVKSHSPKMVWDIGCNTGNYSQIAIQSGAEFVVGFENDLGALEGAFNRSRSEDLPFLPLFLDAANPSPSQGWKQTERLGFQERSVSTDAVLALAVIHHMCIGRNIPLEEFVHWLVDLAPRGVIEFVPKSDPMVQELLAHREDIFPDYTVSCFKDVLHRKARILSSERISNSERELFLFERK